MSRAALMARRGTARHQWPTGTDGLFHGPHTCAYCRKPLEGQSYANVTVVMTGDWYHFACLEQVNRNPWGMA